MLSNLVPKEDQNHYAPTWSEKISILYNAALKKLEEMLPLKSKEIDTDQITRQINLGTENVCPPLIKSITNRANNKKYTKYNFFPKFMFEQLTVFSNFYFLFIAFTQCFASLRVGFIFSYLAPVVIILSFSLINEIIDDYHRSKKDEDENSRLFTIYKRSNDLEYAHDSSRIQKASVRLEELSVGDIIQIKKGQSLPADCLLLSILKEDSKSSLSEDSKKAAPEDQESLKGAYIKTDELDGETDWKLRTPPALLEKLLSRASRPEDREDSLSRSNSTAFLSAYSSPEADQSQDELLVDLLTQPNAFSVKYEAPSKEIYSFSGVVRYRESSQPVSLENTLWASTALVSCTGIALVLYTGKDTRMKRNTKPSHSKMGETDREISFLTQVMLTLMVVLSFSLVSFGQGEFLARFLKYIVLFSHMIPMSLRLNNDISKFVYGQLLKRDHEMAGTEIRTSTIPEELGRINYLFTDKTGTLTQNKMLFRRILLRPHTSYSDAGLFRLAGDIKKGMGISATGPSSNQLLSNLQFDEDSLSDTRKPSGNEHASEWNPGEFLKECSLGNSSLQAKSVLGMSVCHNIYVSETESSKQRQLISSSPDEIALLLAAEKVGIRMKRRSPKSICISLFGNDLNLHILHMLPFSSKYKRMGILAVHKKSNNETVDDVISEGAEAFLKRRPFLLVKGAESSMAPLLEENEWFLEEVDNMAREGLRTLVYGLKFLKKEEVDESFLVASKDSTAFEKMYDGAEKELELIGITGIEDKLQENVQNVLESVHSAGIKIWMLTGDKVETAICVARATRLIPFSATVFSIKGEDFPKRDSRTALTEANRLLDQALINSHKPIVIDGEAIAVFLEHFPNRFAKILSRAESVVCCRCTPEQKSEIVRLVRKVTNAVTLSIGDGGNDISMIREASVGVGIFGLEGKQAALAADYAIPMFSYLQKLLIWHGRNAYTNTSMLSKLVVQRGFLISIVQYIYCMLYYNYSASIFQDFLMFSFTTVYTGGILFNIIWNRDIRYRVLLLYPELYKELQKGRLLSLATILISFIKAIYQGSAIIFISAVVFGETNIRLNSIAFISILFTTYVNIFLVIFNRGKLMLATYSISFGALVASIILYPTVFDRTFLFSFRFLFELGVCLCVAIGPTILANKIYRTYNPPLSAKFKFT